MRSVSSRQPYRRTPKLPVIPQFLLDQLYSKGSLRQDNGDTVFRLHNHLASAAINGLALTLDNNPVAQGSASVDIRGVTTPLSDISPAKPLHFPYDSDAEVRVRGLQLSPGSHTLVIQTDTVEIGTISLSVSDTLA